MDPALRDRNDFSNLGGESCAKVAGVLVIIALLVWVYLGLHLRWQAVAMFWIANLVAFWPSKRIDEITPNRWLRSVLLLPVWLIAFGAALGGLWAIGIRMPVTAGYGRIFAEVMLGNCGANVCMKGTRKWRARRQQPSEPAGNQ